MRIRNETLILRSVNELSKIFNLLDRYSQILKQAGTKWNFLKNSNQAVERHCIGDSFLFRQQKHKKWAIHPELYAGRRLNV